MTTVSAARIGQTRDWNLCTTYNELGLGPDELRRVLVDIPEGWTDRELRLLAQATHAVISRLIGEMGASRQSMPSALRALAGMTAAQIVAKSPAVEDELALLWEQTDETERVLEAEPSPWPEWAAPEMQAALRRSRQAGWGGTRAPWRRLAGLQFAHVRRVAGRPSGFTITDAHDYAALDAAWAEAKAASSATPLLPLPLCCAFVPPARTLLLDDIDPRLSVEVPSAWQLLAQLIVWGQQRTQQRMISWIAACAERTLPPRADRPDGGKPTSETMVGLVRYARRWFLATCAAAPGFADVLSDWREPIELDLDQIANGVDEYMNRTAIPLHIFRRGLLEARSGVAAYRRPDGTMRPGWFRHLRFALAAGMLADIACRPQELAGVKPGDIREHVFVDPETGLQVAVTQVRILVAGKGRPKKGKRRAPQRRWMTIHADTAADLRLWLRLNDMKEHDPLSIWPVYHGRLNRMTGDQLSAVLTATTKGVARIPRLTGRAYTADNLRHMDSQLAQDVGYRWLSSRPAMLSQVSAYAFSEALLCHQPRSDMLGYMDVKRRPELWAARAALGAPGVPGTLALIHEDAGARLGWDIGSIKRAALELELATARVQELQQRIAQLDLDMDALEQSPIKPPVPAAGLPTDERDAIYAAREIAKEERDRALARLRRGLRDANRELEPAKERQNQASLAIERLQAAGRTQPIDDREPTQLELDAETGDGERRVALDEETWEQALERAKLTISFLLDEPAVGPPRIRHILNIPEFAAVMHMTDRALRDRLSGRAPALFPLTGPTSPLVGEGKLRGIDIDKLPDELLRRLLAEQREMIDQFCAVPMGSTEYGGRRG